jgi:hypothetical protein
MKEVSVNDQLQSLKTESIRVLDGLRYLEDTYDPAYVKSLREAEKKGTQLTLAFPNNKEEINIHWK